MAALERSLQEAQGRGGNGDDGRSGRKNGSDGKDGDGGGELAGLSRDELYERAQQADVSGRSSMSKQQLIEALSS
jgi:DNA end-binding protein Ku